MVTKSNQPGDRITSSTFFGTDPSPTCKIHPDVYLHASPCDYGKTHPGSSCAVCHVPHICSKCEEKTKTEEALDAYRLAISGEGDAS